MVSSFLRYRLYAGALAANTMLRRVVSGRGPLIVGPWYGEVGHEVLHWIPFLRWVQERFFLDSSRICAISRGGVASWYRGIADQYADTFDFISLEKFRAYDRARPLRRQMRRGEMDDLVLAAAARKLGWDGFRVLHPSLMHRIFLPFWKNYSSWRTLKRHTKFERFPDTERDFAALGIPKEYVVVKFYQSDCFRMTPESQERIAGIVRRIAEHIPVVTLDLGFKVDDHAGFLVGGGKDIITLPGVFSIRDNLEMQAAIVSRSRVFFGTYGGFSYIAPFYGVPSVGFYTEKTGFAQNHLSTANRVFAGPGFGAFVALPLHGLEDLTPIFHAL